MHVLREGNGLLVLVTPMEPARRSMGSLRTEPSLYPFYSLSANAACNSATICANSALV